MSAATESFLDQLESAVSPAVIGTKKAAKALAPSEFKTSQQDKLGDMKAYKRRQKKMEKGLLNQEVEIDEEDYALPDYPMQLDSEDDDGEWVTGDPAAPIDWEYKGDPLKKADKQVKKDRTSGSHSGVEGALGELASLFQGITGQEPEEPKALEPIPLPEPAPIVPYIDPQVIEEATNELQAVFSDMAGMELFGERPKFEEEKVIEIPVTPPETFDISEALSTFEPRKDLNGAAHTVLQDSTYYDPNDFERTQIVQDVDALLEKHKAELPAQEYKILKTDAAEKTAEYLSNLNLDEVTAQDSMPFTGANAPLVPSGQFTMAVTGILRKMMATGPGSGVVELTKLDDVDATNISATHQFLAWDAAQEKFVAAEGTTPVGDISGVTAGVGLSGGGTQGTVTLDLDVSELTALGATAAFGDYVVIQDVTDNTTKKVLVSNLPASSGAITGVDAGTGLSGGGSSGTVTLNLDTVTVALGGSGSTSASGARTNLGVAVGSDVQAYSATLDTVTAGTYAGDNSIVTVGTVGTGTWQGTAVADGYLGTGINANKIANGSVTSTEFQYINTLASNAQTQITNVKTTADAAASKAFAIAQAVALG